MKWVPHTYRLQGWAIFLSAVACVWVVEMLHYPSWVRFLLLMAAGFPVDFLLRHRPVRNRPSENDRGTRPPPAGGPPFVL